MPLSAYMSPHSQDALEDLGDALSDLEKKLCQHFRRLEIAGKRGRKVPVLLTPAMQEALDLLVSKREMCGVVPGNKYLFARPKACSYFRGSDCLRHFAKMCGAKNPESLTSTKLRKQTATLSQVLNLSNTELDQLADFLGHDVRVHRQFYRLPEGTLQLAKVSKILMALEQGRMAEFKGKGLDDITIDPEDHALQDSEDEDENQNIEEDLDAEMPDETNETSQPVTIETSSHPSLQAVQRPSRKGPSRTPTSARRTVVKRTWNPREGLDRDRVRSSVTREELGVEPLLLHVERSQLRWLGHLFRMPPGRLPGEVFRASPTGRRPRGRPRTRWRDYVSRLAWERLGIPPEELAEVCGDREVWASLLRLLPPRPDSG
ncbi:hypothetical protein WMY93_009280 [Mugilogobius chulae]|uniref:Uncharacterized protein n=1 Tax=Mugilogobius chulae TaxID=88201 RepID=A0AAW0PK14_9GOBI